MTYKLYAFELILVSCMLLPKLLLFPKRYINLSFITKPRKDLQLFLQASLAKISKTAVTLTQVAITGSGLQDHVTPSKDTVT